MKWTPKSPPGSGSSYPYEVLTEAVSGSIKSWHSIWSLFDYLPLPPLSLNPLPSPPELLQVLPPLSMTTRDTVSTSFRCRRKLQVWLDNQGIPSLLPFSSIPVRTHNAALLLAWNNMQNNKKYSLGRFTWTEALKTSATSPKAPTWSWKHFWMIWQYIFKHTVSYFVQQAS